MFSGLSNEAPLSSGWQNNAQMNDYQQRKSRNKEVTGKITTQSIINQDIVPQRQPQLTQKDYERIFYDNPNITQQELQKLIDQYENNRNRGIPSRSIKAESRGGQNLGLQKRTPIKPRESMKDIIYNNVGIGEQQYRASLKQSNRPQNYNYYPNK